MTLQITWLGQSGLILEGGGVAVLVDPWLSPRAERALPPPRLLHWPERIDLVLITHGHGDHLDLPALTALSDETTIVEIAAPYPHLKAIAQTLPAIPRSGVKPGTRLARFGGIEVFRAWHGVTFADGYGPMLSADGTTPHVGFGLTLDRTRLYISGDTLSRPELQDEVAPFRADIAFLPVNGRDPSREARGILGNMNAAEAVALAVGIGARTLVPLHYDGVAGNTADVSGVLSAIANTSLQPLILDRANTYLFPRIR